MVLKTYSGDMVIKGPNDNDTRVAKKNSDKRLENVAQTLRL